MSNEKGSWIWQKERCKKCHLCLSFCPAKALGTDEDGFPCMVDEESCNRCGLCERWCPDFAIEVGGAVRAR